MKREQTHAIAEPLYDFDCTRDNNFTENVNVKQIDSQTMLFRFN